MGAYNRTSRSPLCHLHRVCRSRRGCRSTRGVPLLHWLPRPEVGVAGVEEAGVEEKEEEVLYTGTLFYTSNRCRRSTAAGRGRMRYILAGRSRGTIIPTLSKQHFYL